MASATVRARRVTEPTLVQRHPYQLDDDRPLAELASAWDNITEAKTALYRAEARLEHTESPHAAVDDLSRNPVSDGSSLEQRHHAGVRIPVDHVPSLQIRNKPTGKITLDHQNKGRFPDRTRKRVTIKDHHVGSRESTVLPLELGTPSSTLSQRHSMQHIDDVTQDLIASVSGNPAERSNSAHRGILSSDYGELPGESSSKEILGNGPTNLSAGNSTEIRVLNDMPSPSLVRQSSTVEVSPGLRVSKDYIPAYDRLFGDQPVLRSKDKTDSNMGDALDNRRLLRIVSSSRRPQDQATLDHMERLRERVQQQRIAANVARTLNTTHTVGENQRKRHQESDPVQITSENEADILLGLHVPNKVPVRKVASAPAAPIYKGFNQAESRFRLPDGRIVTEDQLKRKTSRQNVRKAAHSNASREVRVSDRTTSAQPLQPSQRQIQDNKSNFKGHQSHSGQRPVRKVHKASHTVVKPKKPDITGSISARTWREGQKTVNKVLGPPPKVPKVLVQSPPTRDVESDLFKGSERQSAFLETAKLKNEEEIDRLSEHPIESDNEEEKEEDPESNPANLSRLPSEAQGVLDDLHLDNTDDELDKPLSVTSAESKSSKNNNNVPRLSRKKKASRLKSKDSNTVPVKKVRHYEVDDVQKYIAKQRADRRKKLQEEKRQKVVQAEKKKEQLQDLFRRQRESAKVSQRGGGVVDGGENVRQLDETYNKGPVMNQQSTISRPVSLPRHHPFQDNHKRMDVTGSDKENRAFWSTSSSDSSLRSSPQTDLSASTPQDSRPAIPGLAYQDPHYQDNGGGKDIVLEPVTEEEVPASVVIKNQLDSNSKQLKNDVGKSIGSVEAPKPVASLARGGPTVTTPELQSQVHPATATRPPSGLSPTKPRSKSERLAALRATAAALQGRLENEVRQLTGDLSNLASNAIGSGVNGANSSPTDRWAYPLPQNPGAVASNAPSSGTKPSVRFSVPAQSPAKDESKLSRHQKVVGSDKDHTVFKGSLPGVSNLAQQALLTEAANSENQAATTIQAAYRGHSVRQRLNWRLPSGDTLKQKIQGQKADLSFPLIRVSPVARLSPSSGRPGQGHALLSDGESLSEGPLSDESSEAEVDQEYTPKFKSLPTRTPQKNCHPHEKQTNINFSLGYRANEPHRDGLSVIDVYMRRYQEAQRGLLAQQRHSPSSQRQMSPGLSQNYSDDFTGGSRSPSTAASHGPSVKLDSPQYSQTGQGPIPVLPRTSVSSPNLTDISASRTKSSLNSKISAGSRPISGQRTNRSISLPSPGRDDTLSMSETLNSLGVEKKRSRTPSPRPTSLRDAGTQTPPSSRSSPSSVKSRTSSSRGSHSPPSDSRSPVSDHRSPVDEIRSLIEDLKKSTSGSDTLNKTGGRSGISSEVKSSQGSNVRHSPPGSQVESPTSSGPNQSIMSSSSVSRSAKSPVTKEVLSHFRPISHPGSEGSGRPMGGEQTGASSSSSLLSSAISHPGPKFYSPSALQLKMAAELNLLETLEESVRQLTEVERSRAVSLAQQQSSSLTRILQARQRDHEKELQLLSLKAKQEVEAANRHLDEVRHRAATTAMEADQVLLQARKEAAAETRDSAQKLLQTQADAAKVTAEAAKQLAEAHKVTVNQPPPPPPPTVNAGQLAADTAMAAASAAVTAALEQQRVHQRDLLKEMKVSLQPPPPVTRSIGIGDSRARSTSPSQNADSRTPSAHYTEDFSNTTSSLSQTPSSRTPSAVDTTSSQRKPTAADSSLSRHSDVSKSIKTASSMPQEHNSSKDLTDSIATASDIVEDKDSSKSAAGSSIRTESNAKVTSSKDSSITEVVDESKSNADDYSITFENSDSERESVTSVILPTPTPTKPEGKRDARSMPRRIAGQIGSSPRDKNESADSVQTEKDVSFNSRTIKIIHKQLKEEEARAQQQTTLLKMREKVLVDKTNAELEWLEHQKRRLKEKDDQEGVASLRKRQRALLGKLQNEQAEIKRQLTAQKQSHLERQFLLYQQQDISRLRQSAVHLKDQMKDLPSTTPNISGTQTGSDEDSSAVSGGVVVSPDSMSDSSLLPGSPPTLPGAQDATSALDVSAVQKQNQVMQKLKMLQQPLSMKLLTRREMKLKKRRKNVEELLAWKQRLDEEEKQVVSLEKEALNLLDASKPQRKTSHPRLDRQAKEKPPKMETKSKELESYSSASSAVTSIQDAKSDKDISEDYSTKSESYKSSIKSTQSERKAVSGSDGSIAEDIQSKTSSIAEDLPDNAQSSKRVSESPQTVADLSSDDTIKDSSALQDYGSDSFETADRTLTPSKQGAPSNILPATPSLKSLSSSTPKSISTATRRSPLSPAQRSRHPSDSGSESEKSFSQTMSETASDQSDVEGRVRALKDALRRRKMEADRLRKQQKRMNREKLKAQEASLKKQLETYDKFIEKTKAELEVESSKQHQQGSLIPTPSAKPQIKHPTASAESLRQARALRQRTASDSSQEGLSEGRGKAAIKGRTGSESGLSRRSSLEGVGEEKAASIHGSREVSYTSFSATSSPSTQHSEGGASPRSPYSIPRDRSFSASSSIAEDISIRSDFSDKESVQDSEKFDSEDHRKIRERLQLLERDEKSKEADDISIKTSSPIPGARRSGDGSEASEKSALNQVALNASPVVPHKYDGHDDDDDKTDKDISVSSSVLEDIVSAASLRTQDSFESSPKSAVIVPNLPKSDNELSVGQEVIESSHLPNLPQTVVSPTGSRATVSHVPDDTSLKSFKSVSQSSSVHSQSTFHRSARSPSLKSGASYSEDFSESSTQEHLHESKSDTDEDISEHLSEASDVSVARSTQSQHSGQLVFDLKDKPVQEEEDLQLNRDSPEITITPRRIEDEVKDQKEDTKVEPEKSLDLTPESKSKDDVLPGLELGDRVIVGGTQPGTLRFKGYTQFASGLWTGVELDEPLGTNDGKIDGISYFSCKPKFGIFAPPNRITHLRDDHKAEKESLKASIDEDDVSDKSSIEEDIESEASVRTVSESDLIRSTSVRSDVVEGAKNKELEAEDDESELSLSQLTSIRSEENVGDVTDEEMSVGAIDDDTLEKLISHAAEAVESFSHDEPGMGMIDTALETPRGPPENDSPEISEIPHENENRLTENQVVDSITDHLTDIVVKDTLEAVLEVAEKQREDIDEQKENIIDNIESKDKESLLKILVSAESPRSESNDLEVFDEKADLEVLEKQDKSKESVDKKADLVTQSLMKEAISELLAVRRNRNAKIEQANERSKLKESEQNVVHGLQLIGKDEEQQSPQEPVSPVSPILRAETPYTPEKSPERRIDTSPPLSDDIFINRVRVESSSGNDIVPVARPGSPVFGESGSVSPEALNEKLEQLQLLDKDILEADLFGDQEWFDDEFGSMAKSKSIIKVPERIPERPRETPAGVAAQEALVAAKQRHTAKVDLKKIVEEPFYAVPHNVKDVKDLACKSVKVFHEKVLNEEPITGLASPSDILGSDTKGTDIESTSRRAYKNLMFTLSGEVYQAICQEQEPTVQPPWMKPKRKPRRYFFKQPPRNVAEITSAVETRVLGLAGLVPKPKSEMQVASSKLSKKKDHVDEILIRELKAEEPEWVDYDDDELSVKMQLADALFESLLVDTAMALNQIQDRKKARHAKQQRDHFSHHDVEF